MYQRCSQHERIVSILDDYLRKNPKDADLSVVHNYSAAKDLPVELLVQAGIYHVHLGNMEKAHAFFGVFTHETVNDYSHLIIKAADSLMTVKPHAYLMLEGNDGVNKNVFSSESHRDKINGKSACG
uniref:Uncharacterized protein n=1 Tax=Lactuca sativa TaxID=4236 RepID=A0A9R1WGW9_LACSA|nr:hypothetical protein LSAT_V11C100034660 [Lactuca sativa]